VGHGRRATVTVRNLDYLCQPYLLLTTLLSWAPQRAGVQTLFTLAEEAYKYGEVNAPVGAVVGGAVVITAVALASTFAFKSGFEAQDEMAERDKETFNKKRPQRK